MTIDDAIRASEILRNLEERQPQAVSRTSTLQKLSGKISKLLQSGWTEEELCKELEEVMPGLTPASLRFAMKRRGHEIQSATDATLLSDPPPSEPRQRPLRRM